MSRSRKTEFAPGTIIKRDLDGLPGVAYAHVGIYIGQSDVIHFNGTWSGDAAARVERTDLDSFAKGRPVKILAEPKGSAHGQAVVVEALRALENPRPWDGSYNFVFKNCEDFARHCFGVEYETAGKKKKGSVPWSQRAKTIVVSAGTAMVTVVAVLIGRRGKNGPPQA